MNLIFSFLPKCPSNHFSLKGFHSKAQIAHQNEIFSPPPTVSLFFFIQHPMALSYCEGVFGEIFESTHSHDAWVGYPLVATTHKTKPIFELSQNRRRNKLDLNFMTNGEGKGYSSRKLKTIWYLVLLWRFFGYFLIVFSLKIVFN